MANTSKQEITEKTEKTESVTPAGGESDSAVVSRAMGKSAPKSYGRIALEAAIPTTIVAVGVVGMTAAIVAIDNMWGNGSRVNKLIDKGVFDKVKNTNVDGVPVVMPG